MLRAVSLVVVIFTTCTCLTDSVTAQQTVGQKSENTTPAFSSQIRPILSKHCYACHGPDENKREAGLRLDIANEDIDFDYLIERITSDDESEVMPPSKHNKPLDAAKIKLLKKWIAAGANYQEHWAFVLPKKPSVPEARHPVDFFIDRKLSEFQSKRSDRADPATLIRRVYLDLIGLPPTIEQADAFIDNPTQAAYESIVDELLASPQYGERWARRWLDLARYADTNGYEKDRDRSIWPYRDWVIRAINSGMPFDQFTIEQLAGDMLPNARPQQIVATGFHRNTMLNEEGGIDPLEYRYYAMVDRVGTTGATWLGLTTACAQCHTHKFDPITHEDYFGMMAYLDNADEPDYYVVASSNEDAQKANSQMASKLRSDLSNKWPADDDKYDGPSFQAAFESWLDTQRQSVADWQPLLPKRAESNLPRLVIEENGVVFASGDTTKHDTYSLTFASLPAETTAIRLEALPDERLPGFGPGMTYYEGNKGDFFLAEIHVAIQSGGKTDRILEWADAFETHAHNQFGNHTVSAELASDGDIQSGWCVADRTGQRHVAVFNLAEAIPANTPFTLTMEFGRHFASSLGKFRVSAAHSETPIRATTLSESQLQQATSEDASANESVRNAFTLQAKQLSKHATAIRKLLSPIAGTPTLVLQERTAGQERTTYLRNRGEYTQPKQRVAARLPDAIFKGPADESPKNRLQFARWMVSADNPLTARVVANRQWAAFFGTGLVTTLDDFGMQGESPTHPELLDFLAVDLVEQAWSIKKLHRLIVTSQTYQQCSVIDSSNNAEASERLLQRFPRKRLPAETIRDSSLFAAGLLSTKMYGKPVRPLQPAGAAANFSQSKWQVSTGADRFRRSLYTYQKRTAPFAMFTTFDAGSGEACLARRDVSNTPLQALTLMNDPMFVEIAEAYGKRIEAINGDFETKAATAFRWLLTRSPDQDELKMLAAFYEKHKSWPAVARVLLCLDESISKN